MFCCFKVKARDSLTLDVLTVTTYGTLRDSNQYSSMKDSLEKDALRVSLNFIILNRVLKFFLLQDMSLVASIPSWQMRENHVEVWKQLFSTGLSISTSKAAGAINGDRINSTLYLTLSQVRSRLGQSKISQAERDNLNIHLAYTEGCYGGHHTLYVCFLNCPLSLQQVFLFFTGKPQNCGLTCPQLKACTK